MESFDSITRLVFLSIFISCTTPDPIEILASGGSLAGPIYHKWNGAFFEESPSFQLTYVITSTSMGKASFHDPQYFFIGIDTALTASEKTLMSLPPDKDSPPSSPYYFPSVAVPLAFVYNLPVGNPPLLMTFDLLAKIFSRKITQWDHPDLLAVNPNLSGVANRTIVLVLRSAKSGTTQIWVSALNETSLFWDLGVFNQWPIDILSAPYVQSVFGDHSSAFATVQALPFSVSFGPLPLCNSIGVPYAKIRNNEGQIISPVEERELELNENVKDNQFETIAGLLINRPTVAKPLWPIVAISFLLFDETSNQNCSLRSFVLKYFYWILNGDSAAKMAYYEGYIPLGAKFRDAVLPHLLKIKCDNEFLLRYSIFPKDTSSSGKVAGLVISFLFLCSIPVLMAVVVHETENTTSRVFIVLLTLASMINFLTPLFWFMEPSDSVCAIRQWLTCFGLSLLMTLVFSLTLQYYYVNETYMKQHKLGAKIPFLKRMITLVVTIMSIQLVFLIVWSALDPYRSSLTILDNINWTAIRSCTSTHLFSWVSVECAYLLLLLIFGIFCVTYTWRLLTKSSRWLVMCIYNAVVTLLLVAVYLSLSRPTDEELYLVILLFVLVTTVGFDFAVFMPKVVEAQSRSSTENMHSQRTSSQPRTSKLTTTIPPSQALK